MFRSHRLGLLFMIAVTAFGMACGGSDGEGMIDPPPPPEEPDLGDLPIGKFSIVIPEGEGPFPGIEGRWTVEVQADGDFFSTHDSGGGVVGEVTVSGDEMTVTDIAGELICEQPHRSGTYTWTETETTVTFGLVSDGCTGRRFVTLYGPWTKE